MGAITMDQVVEAYMKTKAEIATLDEQIDKLKALQEKRTAYLLNQLQQNGQLNAKTQFGTVYTALKESVSVADWDAVTDFIVAPAVDAMLEYLYGTGAELSANMREKSKEILKSSMRLEFLNKAVNKTAALEQMGEKRDQMPIPGVNYSAVRVAQIRKS